MNRLARIRLRPSATPKRTEIEVDDVFDMLLESYRNAKGVDQHGPAVRAVELLGKHLAMFKDRISFGCLVLGFLVVIIHGTAQFLDGSSVATIINRRRLGLVPQPLIV